MTTRVCLALGCVVLGLAWGVLPQLGMPPFAAHMVMHMSVVAVAAPLLATSLAGRRHDPVRRVPEAFSPIVASMVELVLVWSWHVPALHQAARHSGWARALEQGSFLLAGMYLWMSAFGGGAARRRERTTGGIAGLLLTSMHMTLLGALLVLTHRPLYDHGHAHGALPWGLTVSQDQQLGGAIMILMGVLAYLGGALWLAATALAPRHPERP